MKLYLWSLMVVIPLKNSMLRLAQASPFTMSKLQSFLSRYFSIFVVSAFLLVLCVCVTAIMLEISFGKQRI